MEKKLIYKQIEWNTLNSYSKPKPVFRDWQKMTNEDRNVAKSITKEQ